MNGQITRIAPFQGATVLATLGTALSFFVLLLFGVNLIFRGELMMGLAMMVLYPLMYGATLFLVNLITLGLYNFVAKTIGGIEIEVTSVEKKVNKI